LSSRAPAVAPEMIDVKLQARVALGDLAERRHLPTGQEPDRQPLSLARRPEPVERAVGPPRLLVRLIEGEPEAEHAGPFTPSGHDLLAVGTLEIEMTEDAELVGVRTHRLHREDVDGLAERARRMDHRGVDAGGGHLG